MIASLATEPLWVVSLLFVGLFALSFFFSGTETAFFSLQDMDRRRFAEGRTRADRWIHALTQKRTALITTILMGNETVNVAISATTAMILATLAPDMPWLTIVLVTPALVLFTEITPKVLAYRFNRRWVNVAVWPLRALYVVLWLPRVVIAGFVALMARAFGVTGASEDRPIGEHEFLVLLERSAAQGIVGSDERDIIEAVFELDDLPVGRLMTPKPDIFSLPLDMPWGERLAAIRDARYSRVPIYGEGPDDILGVLLIKDLIRYRRRPLQGAEALQRLLLPPVFVPESKPAHDMMKEMIRRRIHMAFVVDEHGTLTGLVSLDDLIIELVGELGEELDDDLDDDVVPLPHGGWRVRAGLDLEDFGEASGVEVPEGDYHTLAGFVLAELGRIPSPGDAVACAGHRFVVDELEGRRITWLQVTPDPDAPLAEVTA